MCGIAGIFNRNEPVTVDLLQQMAASLVKRGPDDAGTLIDGPLGLVHRRLAIIDLSGGRQPIFNEDRSLAIICNGEIYDYKQRRRELLARGHGFTTDSDSEVILHLYEEAGADCLQRLNGMFAFVIADLRRHELFGARDRFGQKPLFYAEAGGKFAFASGPAALRPVQWLDLRLDATALHDFLEYQYVPSPRSIYSGIRKLEPGSFFYWRNQKLTLHSYWQPRFAASFSGDVTMAAEILRERLQAAVTRRLVADVPVGTFLSGGVDSSLITAAACRSHSSSTDTFSIGFPEPKYDERAFAQAVADHLGTRHHFMEVTPGDFSHLENLVQFYEEPFADASMLPTTLLAQFTRRHVKVALSGDGADELFGGYYRYRIMHLLQALRFVPQSVRKQVVANLLRVLPPAIEERTFRGRLRRLLALSDKDGLDRYLQLISRFPQALRYDLYSDDFRESLAGYDGIEVLAQRHEAQTPMVQAIMEMDCRTYLPDDILAKVDRASMAHGLEVRSPFLDPDVAEFAMSLPYSFKQRRWERKRILREAFSDWLPPEIFRRPKMGFGMPVARWLRNEWKEPVREHLLNGRISANLFRKDRLETLLLQHEHLQNDFSYAIFALLMLELWCEKYDIRP